MRRLWSLFERIERMDDLNLLTAKRQIYLLNGRRGGRDGDALKEKIKSLGADFVVVDLVVAESIPELIKKAYAVLNLESFFTTGEDETRAWTVRRTKAPQAAGVIHTDFERKFIRLEVVSYEKFTRPVRQARAGECVGGRETERLGSH